MSPKEHTRQTRWCTLFAYRKEPAGERVLSPGRQVPEIWQAKARSGELPPVLAELLEGEGDVFDPRSGLFRDGAVRPALFPKM